MINHQNQSKDDEVHDEVDLSSDDSDYLDE